MSLVAIALNLLLASLLFAALLMGWRLNARLKALRESQDGFAKAVADLDAAAQRAEQGLADLRAATDEAADSLSDRIEKARALTARLDRQTEAPRAERPERSERSERPERLELPERSGRGDRPERLAMERPPRERPVRDLGQRWDRAAPLELETEVARVEDRLGALLSGAQGPRFRLNPAPARPAERRVTPPSRPQPAYEDDLFETAASAVGLRGARG